MRNILICNYLFLDEHLCTVSRVELLRAFKKLNYGTFLYAQVLSPNYYEFNGIDKVYADRISSNKFLKYFSFFVKSLFHVPELIINKKINIIIIDPYSLLPLLPTIIINKLILSKKIFILDFRSGIFHNKNSGLKNIFRNYYLKFIMQIANIFLEYRTYISKSLKIHIEKKYGAPKLRTLIWSSGISKRFLEKNLIEKKNPKKIKLIYHGSIGVDRGLTEIVEAVKKLKKIELIIIGKDNNGATIRKINEIINLNKLSNVTINKAIPQNDVINEIINADIGLVLLSDTLPMRTSSPLKLLEYLALNKIILSTRLDSTVSVIEGEKNGIVFINDNSPRNIINGINKIINNYDQLYINAQNGREIIKNKYTWDQQAKNISNFIDN